MSAFIQRRMRAFLEDDDGIISVEAVMILPLLFWAYLATFVFYDAFHTLNLSQKATYTIGDLISRETQPIDPSYVGGARELFNYQTASTNSDTDMRITVVRWDEGQKQYLVDWSKQRGSVPAHTQSSISTIEGQLPVMPDQERVIVVETWLDWSTPFNVGLDDMTMENLVVTRPRFAPQVLFKDQT